MTPIDAVTLSLAGFFFLVEMLHLARALKQVHRDPAGEDSRAALIRPLAFLFFLSTDLSVSFIPLAARDLGGLASGTGNAFLFGLPITVEMLCASVTAVCGGHLVDSRGWKVPFYAGLAVLLAGMTLSGAAASLWVFIPARALVGTGYGFAWMAMRGYVSAEKSAAAKAKGFSQLNAGIYAGNICACVTGGHLAESLGFSTVFFIAAGVLSLAALFGLRLGNSGRASSPDTVGRGVRAFFGDASVLSLCLLVTIPSTICLVGFLNYYFPLLAMDKGLTPAVIGKAFLVYGICVIYLGPYFGRLIARDPGRLRFFLLAGGCTGALSMLMFSATGGIAAGVVAIVLLGVADSMGFVAQNTFLLSLAATRAYGEGKALGMFSMAKKTGQMLGPLVFAWVLAVGPQAGIFAVGALYLLSLAVFAQGSRRAAVVLE